MVYDAGDTDRHHEGVAGPSPAHVTQATLTVIIRVLQGPQLPDGDAGYNGGAEPAAARGAACGHIPQHPVVRRAQSVDGGTGGNEGQVGLLEHPVMY